MTRHPHHPLLRLIRPAQFTRPLARRVPHVALILALLLNLLPGAWNVPPALAAPVTQEDSPDEENPDDALVPYTDPQGLFSIDRPPLFTEEDSVPSAEVLQVVDWAERGALLALFDAQNDENALVFVFVDVGTPFADAADWEDAVTRLIETLAGEELTELTTETDADALYTRRSVRNAQDMVFSLTAYGEGSLLGMAIGASPSDWDALEAPINAALDSFTWEPDAVADFLAADDSAESEPPILLPTPTPGTESGTESPTDPATPSTQEVDFFSPSDGLYTITVPPAYQVEERQTLSTEEVAGTFPGFRQGILSALADVDDPENVIVSFFLRTPAGMDMRDPEIWTDVTDLVVSTFALRRPESLEVQIDEPDNQYSRILVENSDATFLLDIYAEEEYIVLLVAGGPQWDALESIMYTALDSFTWDADVVRAALITDTDSDTDSDTDTTPPAATPAPTDDPPAEDTPGTDDDSEDSSADDGSLDDASLGDESLDDVPALPGFLDFLQKMEDPEGVFTVYAPAHLAAETSSEWAGDVYSVYHAFWASDAEFEDVYYTVALGVVGPANQVMMAYAELPEEEMPAPSLAVPTLEEWESSLALYEEALILPEDAYRVRYNVPGDPYGVLYYAEATDEAADESFRMWTYMTQQDGLGFVVFLLGPLVEPEDILLHADPETRFPVPIDLGLESFTWDLDAAKAAVLDHLAQRYSPAELAALRAQPYSDPLGGFSMDVPPDFTNWVRTLEGDAYSVGVRTPQTRNGLFVRFTDIGETLTPEEWIEVQDVIAAEFWPLTNTNPDDPAPEVLAESVTSEEFNYATYEVVGSAQHGVFEFIEIDGLFAFAAGLVELDDWPTLEADMRQMLASLELDTDVILATLAELPNLPATLTGANVLAAPTGDNEESTDDAVNTDTGDDTDTDTGDDTDTAAVTGDVIAPFVLRAEFADAALDQTLALIVTGPDGTPVGQITGLAHSDVGDAQSLALETGETGGITATFRFTPAAPWQPGLHTAQLYYAETLLGEFAFMATGPTAESAAASILHTTELRAAGTSATLDTDGNTDGDTDAPPVYAPDTTLHYQFNLTVPAAEHQIRLFVYHDGMLVEDLAHTWRLPHGASAWTGRAELLPAADWLPGDYTLRLWVNDSPWDEQSFTIAEDAETGADTEADTVPLTLDSANNLVPQASLEPTADADYIDMIYVDQGRALATLNAENVLVVYDSQTWAEIYRFDQGIFAWNLTTDATGSLLAVAYQDTSQERDNFPIVIWDTATWTIRTVLEGHAGAVTALRFDPSGAWLVSTAVDTTMRAWSLTGELPAVVLNPGMQGGEFAVTTLDISADGQRLALVYSDGMGEMWRINLTPAAVDFQPLYTFEVGGQDLHRLRMFPATLAPDVDSALSGPAMLVVAGNAVQVWTYYDQVAELAYSLEDPTPGRLIAADYSDDAQVLVIAGDTTLLVDTAQGEVIGELDNAAIQLVDISPTGQVALLDGAGDISILAPAE